MLNVKNRLRKKKEFSYIYRKGETVHSKYITVYFVETRYKNVKVGFSISNKIGNSVVRHRVKRRLSEIVRNRINLLPIYNYVFSVKVGIDGLSFDELTKEVQGLIDKLLLKKEK